MKKQLYVILMAGGRGERFWPYSRYSKPKQTLKIGSDRPLLIESIERLFPLIPESNIYISTGNHLEESFRNLLKHYPDLGWIIEPAPRDTAAAIGFALSKVTHTIGNDFIAIILGTDYRIPEKELFHEHLKVAVELANQNHIITLGITPTRPATGYGYIKKGRLAYNGKISSFYVEEFKEKPLEEVAQKYISSGNYLWNSGMFISLSNLMISEIKKYIPALYDGFQKMRTNNFEPSLVQTIFEDFQKISIDFAIMEKTKHLIVLESSFSWDDMGDWLALDRILTHDSNGNANLAHWIGSDTENSFIVSKNENKDKLIATFGVSDLLIIDSGDALLICHKNNIQEIKELIAKINSKNDMKRFL